jgi:hypothetical protein
VEIPSKNDNMQYIIEAKFIPKAAQEPIWLKYLYWGSKYPKRYL